MLEKVVVSDTSVKIFGVAITKSSCTASLTGDGSVCAEGMAGQQQGLQAVCGVGARPRGPHVQWRQGD